MKIHGAKVVPLTHISEVDKTDTMFGSRINSSVNASLPKITHSYRVTLNENKIFSKLYSMVLNFSFHERGGSIYHPWYSTSCDLNKTIQIVIYEASKIPHNACICYVFRIYLNTQSRNLHRLTISVSFMKTLIVKKQDFFKKSHS